MNEPRRIADFESAEHPARLLLRAAEEETPPAGATERAMVALGLTLATTAATSTSAALASAAHGATASASSVAAKSATAGAVKWLLCGALLGASGSTATLWATQAREQPHTSSQTAPSRAPKLHGRQTPRATTAPLFEAATATQEANAAPSPEVKPTSPVARGTKSAQSVARQSPEDVPAATIPTQHQPSENRTALSALAASERARRELALLERARTALAHGDTALTLELLAEHARDYPNGQLQPEASVLKERVQRRMQALPDQTAQPRE